MRPWRHQLEAAAEVSPASRIAAACLRVSVLSELSGGAELAMPGPTVCGAVAGCVSRQWGRGPSRGSARCLVPGAQSGDKPGEARQVAAEQPGRYAGLVVVRPSGAAGISDVPLKAQRLQCSVALPPHACWRGAHQSGSAAQADSAVLNCCHAAIRYCGSRDRQEWPPYPGSTSAGRLPLDPKRSRLCCVTAAEGLLREWYTCGATGMPRASSHHHLYCSTHTNALSMHNNYRSNLLDKLMYRLDTIRSHMMYIANR